MPVAVPARPEIFSWQEFIASLGGIADMAARLGRAQDPELQQDACQQLAMTVAQAYMIVTSLDPDYPQLISYTNPVINLGTNPDFMYTYCAVSAANTYRLSGNRGSSLFTHVTQYGGMIGLDEIPGGPLHVHDIDALNFDADGEFSVLLSAVEPKEHSGNWWKLSPSTKGLSIRQASYDWVSEKDGRFAVECLNAKPAKSRPSLTDRAERLRDVARFTERYVIAFEAMIRLIDRQPANTLELNAWQQYGGLAQQSYYQGRFEIEPHEALIIETPLPERVRYWGIVLNDELFNTLESTTNQSSLNGYQATIDEDGRFRAVVSLSDPGVPNWLDPVGRRRGIVQGRWFDSDSSPKPEISRVPLARLREELPADTRSIDTQARSDALRLRSRGAQFRRKW